MALGWVLRAYCFRSAVDPATKQDLRESEERTNMKLSELKGAVDAVNSQLEKVAAEVQALKDSLADAEIPADAQASLDRLAELTKNIDEINPDA